MIRSQPCSLVVKVLNWASAGLLPAFPQGKDLHPSWRHRNPHHSQKTPQFHPSVLCLECDLCFEGAFPGPLPREKMSVDIQLKCPLPSVGSSDCFPQISSSLSSVSVPSSLGALCVCIHLRARCSSRYSRTVAIRGISPGSTAHYVLEADLLGEW